MQRKRSGKAAPSAAVQLGKQRPATRRIRQEAGSRCVHCVRFRDAQGAAGMIQRAQRLPAPRASVATKRNRSAGMSATSSIWPTESRDDVRRRIGRPHINPAILIDLASQNCSRFVRDRGLLGPARREWGRSRNAHRPPTDVHIFRFMKAESRVARRNYQGSIAIAGAKAVCGSSISTAFEAVASSLGMRRRIRTRVCMATIARSAA